MNEIKLGNDYPTVLKPCWAVVYAGKDRVGQSWQDMCLVHVFAGPIFRPDIEEGIAAACELVLSQLEPLNVLLGGFERADIDNSVRDVVTSFAQMTIEVRAV